MEKRGQALDETRGVPAGKVREQMKRGMIVSISADRVREVQVQATLKMDYLQNVPNSVNHGLQVLGANGSTSKLSTQLIVSLLAKYNAFFCVCFCESEHERRTNLAVPKAYGVAKHKGLLRHPHHITSGSRVNPSTLSA